MFELDKKPPKKQITFRLEESTIKRIKKIEKYNSKIDMLLNFALDNFEKTSDTLNILSKDDLEQINKILHYETFMRLEIDNFYSKLKLRYDNISQGKLEDMKLEYFEKIKLVEDERENSKKFYSKIIEVNKLKLEQKKGNESDEKE